jgi:tRNA threonylcarbamoyladenosine modification (KEOPS) complex  Pcc1 subunit
MKKLFLHPLMRRCAKRLQRFHAVAAALLFIVLCFTGCPNPQEPGPSLGDDASLSSLSLVWVNLGPLDFGFVPSTTSYNLDVPNSLEKVSVTPLANSSKATIKVNGTSVTSGQTLTVTFNEGANLITVEVTAEDEATVQNYIVSVTRAASDTANAKLAWLLLSEGNLSPGFDEDMLSYSASVELSVDQLTVTPFVSDSQATAKVNGVAVAHATPSAPISLSLGNNNITILVTGGDGTTTKSYTVTVIRVASANANLSNLVPSTGSLSPAFDPAITSYSVAVANAVTSIRFTPTAADTGATIRVEGVVVASGAQSGSIGLAVGANSVEVEVTAQDGTTIKTYTVTVTRAAGALHSISGSISGTGAINTTTMLIVYWYNYETEASDAVVYYTGSFPHLYTLSDLPDGTYLIGAFYDADGDYTITPGDPVGQYPTAVIVAGANVTGINFALAAQASGTLTVQIHNAPAELDAKHAYYGVLAVDGEVGVDPWLGFGYFTITAGAGGSVALDDSANPVIFPGGYYEVSFFVDTDGVFDYPPGPEDIPYIFPYTGAPTGWGSVFVDGDSILDLNGGALEPY